MDCISVFTIKHGKWRHHGKILLTSFCGMMYLIGEINIDAIMSEAIRQNIIRIVGACHHIGCGHRQCLYVDKMADTRYDNSAVLDRRHVIIDLINRGD